MYASCMLVPEGFLVTLPRVGLERVFSSFSPSGSVDGACTVVGTAANVGTDDVDDVADTEGDAAEDEDEVGVGVSQFAAGTCAPIDGPADTTDTTGTCTDAADALPLSTSRLSWKS